MSMKYHDYRQKPEYGADGKLTDNWKPCNENGFCKIYIDIDTIGWNSAYQNFSTNEQRDRADAEAKSIFKSLGFINEYINYQSESVYDRTADGKEGLYYHPQIISGVLRYSNIGRIAEAIENSECFKIRFVRLHGDVYDISLDDMKQTVKNEDTKKMILETCKTKRSNLFKSVEQVAESIGNRLDKPTIDTELYRSGKGWRLKPTVIEYMDELEQQGYLVYATGKNDMILVRTINKAEQKQRKLAV